MIFLICPNLVKIANFSRESGMEMIAHQLLVIKIKRTKNTEIFSKFFDTSVVAQEKPLPIDFRKNGSWNVLTCFGSYHKISITDIFFKIW